MPSSYSQLTFLPTPLRRGGGEYQRSDFVMNSWAIHQSGAVLLDPHLLNYLADTPGPQKVAAQASPSPGPAHEAVDPTDWNQDNGWDDSHIAPAPAGQAQEARQPPALQKAKQILKKATEWPMLDPHEPGKEKPFKKGVTYKLPAPEKTAPKKKPMKVRGLNFTQFIYLHRADRKARNEERAQKRLPEEEGEVEDEEILEAVEIFGDDWNEPVADDWVPEIPIEHEPELPQVDLSGPSEAGDLSSYEDLCRMHVQNYLTKTHLLFKQESKLGQRVQHWTQRIGPILDAQERRPEFDLPVYKSEILEKIQKQSHHQKENRSKKGTAVSAETAIGGVESWDVARKFASMLELVNAGQIELMPGHGSFEVRLLEGALAAQIHSPVKTKKNSRVRAPKQVLVQ